VGFQGSCKPGSLLFSLGPKKGETPNEASLSTGEEHQNTVQKGGGTMLSGKGKRNP